MAITVIEQESVEREIRSYSGNSGIAEAKRLLWEAFAVDLEEIVKTQFAKGYDKRLLTIDIREFCEQLNLQPGALKNKMRGFAVEVKRVGRAPYTYEVSVKWLSGDVAEAFITKVDRYMAGEPEDRLMGGLALKGAAVWNGKAYPIAQRGKTKVNGEVTPIKHVLTISKYWRSGSPKHRSE